MTSKSELKRIAMQKSGGMPNYFTDEQVAELCYQSGLSAWLQGDESIKDLLNLAVDTLIGEPFTWLRHINGKIDWKEVTK